MIVNNLYANITSSTTITTTRQTQNAPEKKRGYETIDISTVKRFKAGNSEPKTTPIAINELAINELLKNHPEELPRAYKQVVLPALHNRDIIINNVDIRRLQNLPTAENRALVETARDLTDISESVIAGYINQNINGYKRYIVSAQNFTTKKVMGVVDFTIRLPTQYDERRTLELSRIGVNKEYRRNKVGTILLGYAYKAAQDHNCSNIEFVSLWDATPFYVKAGARPNENLISEADWNNLSNDESKNKKIEELLGDEILPPLTISVTSNESKMEEMLEKALTTTNNLLSD